MALTQTLQLKTGLKNLTTGQDIFPENTTEFEKIEGVYKQIVINSTHPTGHDIDLSDLTDIDFIYIKSVYYETNTLNSVTEGEPAPLQIRISTTSHNDQNIEINGLLVLPLGENLTSLRVSTSSADNVQVTVLVSCKAV